MENPNNLTMVGSMTNNQMKLRPLDFSILDKLTEGRNVAANLFRELDASHQYVNERMGLLRDYGLVKKIGPSERAGLYEITEKGLAVLELRATYNDVTNAEFDNILEEYLRDEYDSSNWTEH